MSSAESAPAESPGAARGDEPVDDRRATAIVAVLSGAGIVVAIMQTLVVPLIPRLPLLLHAPASDASWAITATLLAGAVAMPVLGRLGDLFGKRRMLLVSTGVLVGGSVLCALTDSLAPVAAGRAMQGIGLGAIPLGISIMRDVLPPRRLAGAVAVMSSSMGVGSALGLPLSSLIAQNASWHVLFWISGGAGLLFAGLVAVVVPESKVRASGSFDLVGALALSVGLVALLLLITKGTDWGWASPTTLVLIAVAVVVLAVWGLWETRIDAPLVDLRTTARRQVLLTNLTSVLIGFGMYANGLVAPQVLQLPVAAHGLGRSMLAAGLWMAPGGIVMMAVSPLTAKLSSARGPKFSLLVGSLVMTAGYVFGVFALGSPAAVLVYSVIVSGGVALAYGAMPALIMGAVPMSQSAAANSLNSLMRSVGTATSSAVIAVVLAHMTTRLGAVSVPSTGGLHTALWLGAAMCFVGAVVTLALPSRRPAAATAPAVPAAVHGAEPEPAPAS